MIKKSRNQSEDFKFALNPYLVFDIDSEVQDRVDVSNVTFLSLFYKTWCVVVQTSHFLYQVSEKFAAFTSLFSDQS